MGSSPVVRTNWFTREEWFALPLQFRQLWWRETNYSSCVPSVRLLRDLDKVKTGLKFK